MIIARKKKWGQVRKIDQEFCKIGEQYQDRNLRNYKQRKSNIYIYCSTTTEKPKIKRKS